MRCRDIVVVVVVAGMDYDILTSVSMIMVIFSASGGRWKAASTLRRRPAECHLQRTSVLSFLGRGGGGSWWWWWWSGRSVFRASFY